jgi:hypothetical protein
LLLHLPELLPEGFDFSVRIIGLPLYLTELIVQLVRLPLCLSSQSGNIGDGVFDVGGVQSVYVAQDRDRQRASADKEGEPFTQRESEKKILGWFLVFTASAIGALGAALGVGSLDGGKFDLSRRVRIRYGAYSFGLVSLAGFILIQLAAPLLRP